MGLNTSIFLIVSVLVIFVASKTLSLPVNASVVFDFIHSDSSRSGKQYSLSNKSQKIFPSNLPIDTSPTSRTDRIHSPLGEMVSMIPPVREVGRFKISPHSRTKRSPKSCWGIPEPLPQRCRSPWILINGKLSFHQVTVSFILNEEVNILIYSIYLNIV